MGTVIHLMHHMGPICNISISKNTYNVQNIQHVLLHIFSNFSKMVIKNYKKTI